LLWVLSIGIGLVLLLSGFLFHSRNRVKHQNKRIENLMRELHHRVKNNLQVISSLLGLQSSRLQDASAKMAVEDGKQRIKAMSLIHQKLYIQDTISALNLQEYIHELVFGLADSFGIDDKKTLEVEVPAVEIDVDTALLLGLIVNELVTNSLKYAFKDVGQPILQLRLRKEGKRSFLMEIKDNGQGLPDGFDLQTAQSFGLRLVNILIQQLNGTLKHSQEDGLRYEIRFQAA
jgi:two-component sensor histidine kinase